MYIDDLNIKTEEIKIKDIISIIKKHSPSIQLIILEKIIKGGSAVADININMTMNLKLFNMTMTSVYDVDVDVEEYVYVNVKWKN